METAIEESRETALRGEQKKKRNWGKIISNSMAFGGFLVAIAVIFGILIFFSYLFKW